jgi:hypothetical protein
VNDKMVRYLDPTTDTIVSVPLRELSPGAMLAALYDEDEAGNRTLREAGVYIEAGTTVQNKVPLHPEFADPDVLAELRRIYHTIKDVFPKSWDDWLLGFRCDLNPQQEIKTWSAIAEVYRAFGRRALTARRKRDVFRLIMSHVNGGPDYALRVERYETLSDEQVREIVQRLNLAVRRRFGDPDGQDPPPIEMVRLDGLDFGDDEGPLDEATQRIIEVWRGGGKVPAILAMRREGSTCLVIDGRKRCRAAKALGLSGVAAYVIQELPTEEAGALRHELNAVPWGGGTPRGRRR